MKKVLSKRGEAILGLLCLILLPLRGGTGKPADGFLSFILLLGFLGIILGILYGIDYLKRIFSEFHRDIS
jgi:hypothetical protein